MISESEVLLRENCGDRQQITDALLEVERKGDIVPVVANEIDTLLRIAHYVQIGFIPFQESLRTHTLIQLGNAGTIDDGSREMTYLRSRVLAAKDDAKMMINRNKIRANSGEDITFDVGEIIGVNTTLANAVIYLFTQGNFANLPNGKDVWPFGKEVKTWRAAQAPLINGVYLTEKNNEYLDLLPGLLFHEVGIHNWMKNGIPIKILLDGKQLTLEPSTIVPGWWREGMAVFLTGSLIDHGQGEYVRLLKNRKKGSDFGVVPSFESMQDENGLGDYYSFTMLFSYVCQSLTGDSSLDGPRVDLILEGFKKVVETNKRWEGLALGEGMKQLNLGKLYLEKLLAEVDRSFDLSELAHMFDRDGQRYADSWRARFLPDTISS